MDCGISIGKLVVNDFIHCNMYTHLLGLVVCMCTCRYEATSVIVMCIVPGIHMLFTHQGFIQNFFTGGGDTSQNFDVV